MSTHPRALLASSTQKDAMTEPGVFHHWRGDTKLLQDTALGRTRLRKALESLQQELQSMSGCPTQIQAEIRFNVQSSTNPRENCYTVSATGIGFDADLFARTKTVARAPSNAGGASSPPTNNNTDRPSSRRSLEYDDVVVVEDRPVKRPRTENGESSASSARNRNAASLSEDTTTIQRVSEVLSFVKDWHGEWTRQGGWLFDTLNSASKANAGAQLAIETKLDAVQDVIGQSINAASATTMSELANISKLLPWLEHCRKTNADKVQAREEKWRSSSATFHDQNRRDREAAEKQIKEQLEFQRHLLVKLAEANGIDVDEEEKLSEASLGAQLRLELNLEASRHDDSRRNSRQETMHIDE